MENLAKLQITKVKLQEEKIKITKELSEIKHKLDELLKEKEAIDIKNVEISKEIEALKAEDEDNSGDILKIHLTRHRYTMTKIYMLESI